MSYLYFTLKSLSNNHTVKSSFFFYWTTVTSCFGDLRRFSKVLSHLRWFFKVLGLKALKLLFTSFIWTNKHLWPCHCSIKRYQWEVVGHQVVAPYFTTSLYPWNWKILLRKNISISTQMKSPSIEFHISDHLLQSGRAYLTIKVLYPVSLISSLKPTGSNEVFSLWIERLIKGRMFMLSHWCCDRDVHTWRLF